MKRISSVAAAAVGLLGFTSHVLADPVSPPSSKFYVGLDIGNSRLDASLSQQFFGPGLGQQRGDDVGFRLRVGVQFSRYIAVEAGYADFGDFTLNDIPYVCAPQQPGPCTYNVSSSTHGVIVGAVGSWPFAEHWSLNGRLGGVYMDVSTSERDPDVPSSAANYSNSGWGLHYGAGLGYQLNPRMALSLDWARYDQIDLGLTIGGAPGAYTVNTSSLASLGFTYRF
jgi:OmpA-OmpF porin, OOP family